MSVSLRSCCTRWARCSATFCVAGVRQNVWLHTSRDQGNWGYPPTYDDDADGLQPNPSLGSRATSHNFGWIGSARLF
eukprot:3401663-Amphidinium_carterae.1